MPSPARFNRRLLVAGIALWLAFPWKPAAVPPFGTSSAWAGDDVWHGWPRVSGGSLNPSDFGRLFARFRYEFGAEVRPAEIFLRTGAGDCDDFAVLAAGVFREQGARAVLYSIRLPGETHVICHLPDAGGYLDFNRRADPDPFARCASDPVEIAASVAGDFGRPWLSISEFVFEGGRKWQVRRLERTEIASAKEGIP